MSRENRSPALMPSSNRHRHRDLESRVEDLERNSAAKSHENRELRAQVETLQSELREYRRRLSQRLSQRLSLEIPYDYNVYGQQNTSGSADVHPAIRSETPEWPLRGPPPHVAFVRRRPSGRRGGAPYQPDGYYGGSRTALIELEEPQPIKLADLRSDGTTPPPPPPKGTLDAVPEDSRYDHHDTDSDDTMAKYPTAAKLALITLALCLAVFLMALDQSILATAIPRITDEFHSLSDVGWYGSAYLLTTAALQLQFGKFYTFMNIKWTFLVAIAIFELGSVLCGAATSSAMLIVGRAIAGLGSAGIYSGALLILANSVPLEKRPAYIGLVGSMYGISSVAGPLMGGVFTDRITWRWCFYINLPIGAVTVAIIIFFFPPPQQTRPPPEHWLRRVDRFDPIGTLLLLPGVICLLLALQWGGTAFPWGSARIAALLAIGGAALLGFTGTQVWRKENATVPPRLFRSRTVWGSVLYAFGMGAAFFIGVYFLPLWFQAVKGVSAVDSGIRILPMMVSAVVMSLVSGLVVTAQGLFAPWMLAGTVGMAVGAGLLSTWTVDTGLPVWIGYQVLFGAGVGMCLQQPLVAVQTVLELRDVAVGASLIVFTQSLGGAMFVSVGNSVFANALIEAVPRYAPGVDPTRVIAVGATDVFKAFADSPALPGIIVAYNEALTRTFLIAAAMAATTIVGGLCVEWRSVKGKQIEAGMA